MKRKNDNRMVHLPHKMRWLLSGMLLLALLPVSLNGQRLIKNVLASGGDNTATTGIRAGLTLGQVFIGPAGVSDIEAGVGFWYGPDSTITIVRKRVTGIEPVPVLLQNEPNPFMDMTVIRFSIPHSGSTRVSLWDIHGTLEQVLLNQFLEAGEYELELSAQNLPSGTYVYCLDTGGLILTKKCAVIR